MVPNADILKRLEPAVRPVEGDVPRRSGSIEQRSFRELIAESQSNGPVSAATLKLADGIEATPDQRAALAKAANRAIAAGVERVMVLMDGRALVVDVPERRAEAELDLGSMGDDLAVTPVQGVVVASTGMTGETDANQRLLDQLRAPAVAARLLGS